ncbi:MAG: aspartate-semialdehyde dehydrogenase [Candidatus Fermentibacteraceae bacterium]
MLTVGVVGATGLVGSKMIEILQERSLPVKRLLAFASQSGPDRTVSFHGESIPVEIINPGALEKGTVLFGATSSGVAVQWVPPCLLRKVVIIDNSSAFRMSPEVPLVVPEVNPHAIPDDPGLIANPNCSTIQLVTALAPLARLSPIEWVSVSTYQSVSGAGARGVATLEADERLAPAVNRFHRNVVCEIGDTGESGYTTEETKLVRETVKIMGMDFPVFPAAARVPVGVGHTESVTVRFRESVSCGEAERALLGSKGIGVARAGVQPVAAEGTDPVWVGRLRNHPSDPRVLQFWVTADNVRKGAALNAVQILELLLNR